MKTLLALLLLIPSLSWGLDVGNGSLGEWHKELTSKLGSKCDFLGIERNENTDTTHFWYFCPRFANDKTAGKIDVIIDCKVRNGSLTSCGYVRGTYKP